MRRPHRLGYNHADFQGAGPVKLISRYTLRQIGVPALLAAGVIGFFIVGGTVRNQMGDLIKMIPADQVRVFDVSRISFYALPTLAGYIIPITFLMGIMFAFSRMVQFSEIIAMKAAGIPLKRIVLPVIAAGAVLSGVVYTAQDMGRPWAYRRMMGLLMVELPLRMTIDMLPTGSIQEYSGWRVYIGKRDADGTLRNLTVLQPADEGGANAFYADSARLIHENGRPVLEMRKGYLVPADPTRHITFETLKQPVPTPETRKVPNTNDGMTMRELFSEERRLGAIFDETGSLPVASELRGIRIEVKNRLSFPLMCLAVSLVGAPIGARTRRSGRSYAFAAGLLMICLYFVLRKLVEPTFLASLPVTVAMGQIPNMLLAVTGLALIGRVDRV
jgi:lipopolysaccharide export system permease protein